MGPRHLYREGEGWLGLSGREITVRQKAVELVLDGAPLTITFDAGKIHVGCVRIDPAAWQEIKRQVDRLLGQ